MTFDASTPMRDRIGRVYDGGTVTINGARYSGRLVHYGRIGDAPPITETSGSRTTIIVDDERQKGGRRYWRTLLGMWAWRIGRRLP